MFRHLNPFVPLAQFGEEDKKEELYEKASTRNTELISLGEENPILYLEYSYVKEEFRRNGIFTLNLDGLKTIFKDAIIWLNMEPLDESELDSIDHPILTTEEYQQITLNNLIAEKTGFTVDNDLWEIQVKDDTKQTTKKMKARKCAYLIPEIYQNIIKDDKDLVEQGRIRQKLKQENQEMKNTNEPKLTKTYDADMSLDDFTFIGEDTELDFSDYLILKSDYTFYSNNPIPMSAAVITELVLQNQSNHKNYYFTLLCDDCIHALYITDKPFKETLCAILDSED